MRTAIFVREVLNGFPAEKAGVLKNDRILKWQGLDFDGTWGTQASVESIGCTKGALWSRQSRFQH